MNDVWRAAERRAAALAEADWRTLEACLHPEFAYVNAEGIRLDRDEYLAFVRDGPLRWKRQSLEDVEVKTVGDLAVLTATVRDEVFVDEQLHEFVFVSTQTYVRAGDRWLYLAGQTGPKA